MVSHYDHKFKTIRFIGTETSSRKFLNSHQWFSQKKTCHRNSAFCQITLILSVLSTRMTMIVSREISSTSSTCAWVCWSRLLCWAGWGGPPGPGAAPGLNNSTITCMVKTILLLWYLVLPNIHYQWVVSSTGSYLYWWLFPMLTLPSGSCVTLHDISHNKNNKLKYLQLLPMPNFSTEREREREVYLPYQPQPIQ